MTTKNRPPQVAWWTSRGRKYDRPPEVGRPKEFASSWRKWYITMQDSERGDKWPLAKDDDRTYNWTELTKGGRNGFFMLLLTLVWWQKALRTPAEHKEFDVVLDEVDWALTRIVAELDMKAKEGKHPREDPEEEDSDRPMKK